MSRKASQVSGGYWYGHHQPGGPLGPQGGRGCRHRRAGGEAVVYQDHDLVRYVRRGAPISVQALPPLQRSLFGSRDGRELPIGDTEAAHGRPVDHSAAARCDRPDRDLRVRGGAELPHDEDVEGRVERAGDS
jgi:hypothetical protein